MMGSMFWRAKPGALARMLAWLLATLLSCGAVQAGPLRVAGNFPVDHSSSVAMAQFKQDVEKAGGGALQVELYPAMKLGSARDNVEQVRSGAIFMTWIPPAYLSSSIPELSALSIPFAFADRQAAFRVVDGRVGRLLADKLAAKGLVLLGFMELGPRQLTSGRRPIRSLADLQGLRLRLQPDEIHMATFRALGAQPVAIDVKDLYGALESGAVDAQENPFSVIRQRNFDKVQKYLANTSHFFDFIMLLANQRLFDGLRPEQQKIVREAAAKAVYAQRIAAAAEDIGAIVELANRGMVLEPVRPSFRADLRRATQGVVEDVRRKAGAQLVDAVLNPGS